MLAGDGRKKILWIMGRGKFLEYWKLLKFVLNLIFEFLLRMFNVSADVFWCKVDFSLIKDMWSFYAILYVSLIYLKKVNVRITRNKH